MGALERNGEALASELVFFCAVFAIVVKPSGSCVANKHVMISFCPLQMPAKIHRHAAECGPDPLGHKRALEGPFSDLRIQGLGSSSPASISGFGNQGRNLRRQILYMKCAASPRVVSWEHMKGTALFCCRMRPRPLGHTRALEGPCSE